MDWTRPYRLACGIQHYDWGERATDGTAPYIARLLGIEANGRPYAELWMGDHPALPARLPDLPGRPSLRQVIQAHADPILGSSARSPGTEGLPFLFKILSCEQPLSIQAHPDRARAAALHRRDPTHYPDANHKPEIALSLTQLEALAAFRRREEIRADIAGRPALQAFFAAVDEGPDWLRRAYTHVFRASDIRVSETVTALRTQLADTDAGSSHDGIFMTCSALYPKDRGAISVYFLNHVRLQAGDALFIPPNEPHAYLKGTILECMAASDNVVRAGLTRKFIDREVLLDMLTYDEGRPPIRRGQDVSDGARRYSVPAPDFEVMVYNLSGDHRIEVGSGVSIALILEGTVTLSTGDWSETATRGSIWLVPAAADEMEVRPQTTAASMARAYVPMT